MNHYEAAVRKLENTLKRQEEAVAATKAQIEMLRKMAEPTPPKK